MRIDRKINRAGAVIALAVIVTVTALSVHAGWTPADLPGTLVWLDASDTGTLWADTNGTVVATNKVARWDDKSGNGNHMLQANTSYQPVSGTRMINGLNTVDFDGNDDRMQELSNAFGSVISNVALFVICKEDNANFKGIVSLSGTDATSLGLYERGNFCWNANTARYWASDWTQWGTVYTNQATMHAISYSATENIFKAWQDGELRKSKVANGGDTTDAGILLANSQTTRFEGLFAEVVIVNGIITTEERQTMEGYLAWKWGMAGRLPDNHPYRWYEAGRPPAGTQLFGR